LLSHDRADGRTRRKEEIGYNDIALEILPRDFLAELIDKRKIRNFVVNGIGNFIAGGVYRLFRTIVG
jgi:hypothetical protein